jgi:hypothetical protein
MPGSRVQDGSVRRKSISREASKLRIDKRKLRGQWLHGLDWSILTHSFVVRGRVKSAGSQVRRDEAVRSPGYLQGSTDWFVSYSAVGTPLRRRRFLTESTTKWHLSAGFFRRRRMPSGRVC